MFVTMVGREPLEASRESWQESTEHDKRQLILSLGIGGAGLFLAGVGIVGIVAGAPIEGAAGVAAGGTLTYWGAKDAERELRSMLEMQAITAQREQQLRELDTE